MTEHAFDWGPFTIHLYRGGYRLRLHGTAIESGSVLDAAGAAFPARMGLAAALAHAEEVAAAWGVHLPPGLPAQALAIARWF